MLGGRARVLFVLAAMAVALVLAVPASGNFPQSIESTIPAGGEGYVASSTLPPTATSATITVTPSSAEDATVFNDLTEMLSAAATTKARVLTCVGMYLAIKIYSQDSEDYEIGDPSLQFLFLKACLQLAFSISQQHGPLAASGASAACPQQVAAIGVRVTRSGGQYHAHVKGTTHRPSRRSALVVSCRRVGTGLQIGLRPRVRGRTLSQVAGPTLGIGFLNRSTGHTVHVNTAFAVR